MICSRIFFRNCPSLVQYCIFNHTCILFVIAAHESFEHTFSQTIYFLPILQQINDDHAKTLNDIKMENPTSIPEFPDLHNEVYGT